MTIGLLDLGSNTIKLAIYAVDDERYDLLYYDASYAYIIGFVENNRLQDQGIAKIISTLQYYKGIAQSHHCDHIHCFSTASLRYIENQQEVVKTVLDHTGIPIEPITGTQEALYNSLSMKQVVADSRFVGADLGGGSLQLFCHDEGKPLELQSFPLGSLKIYKQFVKGTFPTVNEMMAIKTYVLHQLELGNFKQGCRNLYQMGGTARSIAELLGVEESFTITDLESAISGMIGNYTLAENTIQSVNPNRRLTILPGMIIIYAVADYLQANTITYTQNSVREGYLIAKYFRKDDATNA